MLMFIIIKIKKHKFKNIIFNKKHLINFQVIKIIIFKTLIKNYKIIFSFTFNINENIFIIH